MTGLYMTIKEMWISYSYMLDIVLSLFFSLFIIYYLILFTRKTKSILMVKTIIILFFIAVFSEMTNLTLIGLMTRWFLVIGIIMMTIVFQAEIKSFFTYPNLNKNKTISLNENSEFIEEILNALKNISRKGRGALFVFEKEIDLKNYIDFGTKINSEITAALLEAIFAPYSPLHDGAVVFLKDKIISAGAILPLTHNPVMSKDLGTRHRAAIGISEVSNVIVCVISEETGEYSIAEEGKIRKGVEISELKKALTKYHSENKIEKKL